MSKPRKQKQPETMTKMDIRRVTMENPYFNGSHEISQSNPKVMQVVKNLRESAIETLFARHKIDRSQKEAADRFRLIWEMCGGAGSGATDYSREHVDGGGARDPIAQRQVDAGKALSQCRNLLGARNYALVRKICGEGYGLQQVATTKRGQLTAADNLRASLDDLAEMWGLKQKE